MLTCRLVRHRHSMRTQVRAHSRAALGRQSGGNLSSCVLYCLVQWEVAADLGWPTPCVYALHFTLAK
eukprot:1160131-Pelagomonas_calceolata.AAC.10